MSLTKPERWRDKMNALINSVWHLTHPPACPNMPAPSHGIRDDKLVPLQRHVRHDYETLIQGLHKSVLILEKCPLHISSQEQWLWFKSELWIDSRDSESFESSSEYKTMSDGFAAGKARRNWLYIALNGFSSQKREGLCDCAQGVQPHFDPNGDETWHS